MDKILVIIVTYNAHQWIRQCLSSVDVNKYAVLVVDNASEDDTVDIIRESYSEVELICSKTNLGFGKANNIGLQKAIDEAYDYVLLLNQDAWLEEDTLDRLVTCMKQNTEYGIISPLQYNSIEGRIESLFNRYLIKNNIDINLQTLQSVDFVNAAIWLISRETIELVGAFDPIFPHYGEDNDYVYRLHYWNKKIGVDTSTKSYHDRMTKEISIKRRYDIDVKRLEIFYMSMLNNINYTLVNRIVVISLILVKKIIKYSLSGNFRVVNKCFKSYCQVLKELHSLKACRIKTATKKAYIQ